ncbi:hypothetical protein JCM33374_g2267 [Metschnikowia sp. JCM 33374]|nr:hypothetical protein JCM33374_g2267 [Metschnikowia sp. JCM 33374]
MQKQEHFGAKVAPGRPLLLKLTLRYLDDGAASTPSNISCAVTLFCKQQWSGSCMEDRAGAPYPWLVP